VLRRIFVERQVLYDIIEDRGIRKEGRTREKRHDHKSIHQISKILGENESHIKDALAKISSKKKVALKYYLMYEYKNT
jgi:hypothetical protein